MCCPLAEVAAGMCVCVIGCVGVLQQKTSGRLSMSVHRNAGEVVPDDLVHCQDKRETAHC